MKQKIILIIIIAFIHSKLNAQIKLLSNIVTQDATFAYPITTTADLSSIMYSGQQSITAFTKTIVFIKNAQGHVQQYKVYISNERYGTPIEGITFQ